MTRSRSLVLDLGVVDQVATRGALEDRLRPNLVGGLVLGEAHWDEPFGTACRADRHREDHPAVLASPRQYGPRRQSSEIVTALLQECAESNPERVAADDRRLGCRRSEERRVGKECGSR